MLNSHQVVVIISVILAKLKVIFFYSDIQFSFLTLMSPLSQPLLLLFSSVFVVLGSHYSRSDPPPPENSCDFRSALLGISHKLQISDVHTSSVFVKHEGVVLPNLVDTSV